MLEIKSNQSLLIKLEQISQIYPNRILRLRGFLLFNNGAKEFLEILVYKGFSSSTTHPTEWDIENSSLPKNGYLEEAELLEGPINPSKEVVIKKPTKKLNNYLSKNHWK